MEMGVNLILVVKLNVKVLTYVDSCISSNTNVLTEGEYCDNKCLASPETDLLCTMIRAGTQQPCTSCDITTCMTASEMEMLLLLLISV